MAFPGLGAENAELRLREADARRIQLDEQGQRVGRLASRFTIPSGMRPAEARVHAVIVRDGDDSEPEYRGMLRCDRWEVVLPEIVLVPE